jgi:hypothetical protein
VEFRPFSRRIYHLYPSCSQKRALLFGECLDERPMLLLPHRQVVFTFPKVLGVFFRHDRSLYTADWGGPEAPPRAVAVAVRRLPHPRGRARRKPSRLL